MQQPKALKANDTQQSIQSIPATTENNQPDSKRLGGFSSSEDLMQLSFVGGKFGLAQVEYQEAN